MALRLAPSLQPPAGRRARSRTRVALFVLAAIVILTVGLLAGLRLARAGTVLPGVTVDGVEVGGLSGEQLRTRLTEADRADEPIVVVAGDDRAEAAARDLGYRFDREATAEAAWRHGRQLNPVAALADQLRAFAGPIPVTPRITVDRAELRDEAERLADALSHEPVEGDLRFVDGDVERVEPAAGHLVDAGEVAEAVRPVLTGAADGPAEVGREPVQPATTAEAVREVAAEAEHALSAPVTLTRGDVTWQVEPAALGETLEVERDGGDLTLAIDAVTVEDVAGDVVEQVHEDPVDAQVRVAGGSPEVVPSQDGFAFDAEVAAEQLLELATGDGDRTEELEGELLLPDRTTAEAEALDITEQVSSFTTHFTPGQSRVQNIQRIAEIIDGVLIEPDETLSVNGYVGERTRDKGFTEGGAIFEGEFVTDVGGGVSQFATTMYNAAYFGGYEIPDFKPHSYYISRYPVGREATIDYPHVDLKVHNNSPHGLLVSTSSTGSSVTVSMWGTTWVQVDSVAGERRNVTPPPTERRETRELPEGTERVLQSGREGFTITVTRVLRFPDGEVERGPVTTRYLPEPRIIEVGTGDSDDESAPPEDDQDE